MWKKTFFMQREKDKKKVWMKSSLKAFFSNFSLFPSNFEYTQNFPASQNKCIYKSSEWERERVVEKV